jgi:hypothetical protein
VLRYLRRGRLWTPHVKVGVDRPRNSVRSNLE